MKIFTGTCSIILIMSAALQADYRTHTTNAYKRAYRLITHSAGTSKTLLRATAKLNLQDLEELLAYARVVGEERKEMLHRLEKKYGISSKDASWVHEVIHKASIIALIGGWWATLTYGILATLVWVPTFLLLIESVGIGSLGCGVYWFSRKRINIRRSLRKYEHAQRIIIMLQYEVNQRKIRA